MAALEAVSKEKAAETIDITEEIGRACLEKYGTRIAYCADELFLKAGRAIPEAAYYEDFPQLENPKSFSSFSISDNLPLFVKSPFFV